MNKKHSSGHSSHKKSIQKRTQWHPPFCASMRLEMIKDKTKLDYTMEHCLSTKPLQIDLLIIKKVKNAKIINEIGQFFKQHNVCEYKSPDDDLDIDVFFKVIAYALFYKSSGNEVNSIDISDITVTFVRKRKPVKLFDDLKRYNILFEQTSKGIYMIKWEFLCDVQILVTREMNPEEHIWLTSLSDHIEEKQARRLIKEVHTLTEKDDKEYADSVLQIAMERNKEIFDKIRRDELMCQALWDFFKTEIEQEKRNSEICGERRGEQRGERRGEQRGAYTKLISIIIKKIQRGKDILSISDALEEPVEVIRPIYEAVLASPGLDAEQIYKKLDMRS